jgi:probable HAF family extracellular repeat protein
MNRKVRLITLAFILAVAAPAYQATAYYKLIDLDTLGGNSSGAYSINNLGQIVGHADDSSGYTRATLFDPTDSGNNIDLGTLGGIHSTAFSINDLGQIVGSASDGLGKQRATLFDPTGGGHNITLGGTGSVAWSINDNGQIVGCVLVNSMNNKAILFDPTGGGKNISLGTLGGRFVQSVARSINDSGQIVGWSTTNPFDPSWKSEATLFDPTGGGNNIALCEIESEAWSINNLVQIVGRAGGKATLFDPTGGGNNIDLGTLGGTESWAWSINDHSQIVGWAYDSLRNQRATLFDPTGSGNNINLNTLIDPSLGWTLTHAYSINDNGWIVGVGWSPTGYDERAYLLIPEPATVLLFGLSSLAMLTQRKVLLKR